MRFDVYRHQADDPNVLHLHGSLAADDLTDAVKRFCPSGGEYGLNSETEGWVHVPGQADYTIRTVTETPAPAPLFEVPNLDDLTTEPAALFEVAEILTTLSLYATFKAGAVAFRRDGQIGDALRNEAHCQRLYDSLPVGYRW